MSLLESIITGAVGVIGGGGAAQLWNAYAASRAQGSDAARAERKQDTDAERAIRDELRTELASSKTEAKLAREEAHRLNRENAMLSARLESTNARLAHLEQQNGELLETVETLRREFAHAFRDGRESRVEPTVPALPRPRTKTNQ
jgi:septal ring factor EnvC (AmiA/AmiB activator)